MPRQGTKSISVPELYAKLIDLFIETRRNELILKNIKPSRPGVVEIAVLKFLEIQGVLEPLLKELGVEDSAIKSIKERLKVVG